MSEQTTIGAIAKTMCKTCIYKRGLSDASEEILIESWREMPYPHLCHERPSEFACKGASYWLNKLQRDLK